MRLKCKLRLWEEMPTIDIENGTTITHESIGFIGHNFGGFPKDLHYEKITKDDIKFILENEVECEIEMVDEFESDEEINDELMFHGDLTPKLHKGKVIIYLL